MRAVRMIAASDEYDNKPGLRIVGIDENLPGFMVAREGLLIAHDVIEHQNGFGHIGKVWDELEALGGIWYIRGRWGDMMTPSIHSPQTNVASDVSRMLQDWLDETTPRCHQFTFTRPCDYDEDFDEILAIARKNIRAEDPECVSSGAADEYLIEAKHRLRIGFRKAWRRFDGSGFAGNNQFRAIKEAVDQHLRWGPEFEGQEFILTYGGGEANMREVQEADYA